ncbi:MULTISPECIES: hypothetical protein [Spirulina sp. CCY15215]|uniref:hypothetical protein n=1 Tax=Spirulina sp. CCY15215 TaxID=2767591 RepID=UPI00194F9586|nr:hypothetical protein [Spirulina major]
MKPKFSTLIILTLLAAILLAPFVFSPYYLPNLRDRAFELHLILQGEIYKQITGYSSLLFVFLEMLLMARKRGRSWLIKIKLPGSLQFWRSLHIFLGIALLGTTLIHTIGSRGLNFNAIFLWVFFGVTLSALVGAVAETGVLESSRRYFGWIPQDTKEVHKSRFLISKAALIRNMRAWWLNTHIFLVAVFCVMLVFHIFLAYYYQ